MKIRISLGIAAALAAVSPLRTLAAISDPVKTSDGKVSGVTLASGVRAFKDELAGFKTSKGAIQFPLDRPLPLGLIAKIVRYRARENRSKTKQ